MKKILVILVALIGFVISANAQYTFYISSGKFVGGGISTTDAYSGKYYTSNCTYNCDFRNNPANTHKKNEGSIPTGTYYITNVDNSITSNTIVLTNDTNNDMYGRDGFRIHGGNSDGSASRGCIIMPPKYRQKIVNAYNNWVNGGKKGAILTLYVYE